MMSKSSIDIGSIRVAKPCHMTWDSMHGGNRVRRFGECELNIYNIADMTAGEVESLIGNREGRLCIRLHRRADGTVITRDCPVGLRAYQKRVARMATAVAAAVLGFFSVSFGQKKTGDVVDGSKIVTIENKLTQIGDSSLKGTVVDPQGAVIPGATILLFRDNEKKEVALAVSNEEGKFVFAKLTAGVYRVEAARTGFKKMIVENIRVDKDLAAELALNLTLKTTSEVVGIFLEEPMIDFSVTGPTPVKLTKEQIERIPGRRPF